MFLIASNTIFPVLSPLAVGTLIKSSLTKGGGLNRGKGGGLNRGRGLLKVSTSKCYALNLNPILPGEGGGKVICTLIGNLCCLKEY